jgi:hypothetical protein
VRELPALGSGEADAVTAALALAFEPDSLEVTPRAARDLAWLQRALGRRYGGWRDTGDALFGPAEVMLTRSSGRRVWFYGTLEQAAAKARRTVEEAGR